MSVDSQGLQAPLRASWRKTRINTNATTVIKAAPGLLHAIIVNTKGATANTITIYDNTAGSGTVVGVIDSTAVAGAVFAYDCDMGTGITIVTAAGTAPDLTILWA